MTTQAAGNPFGLRLALFFTETTDGNALRHFYGSILGLDVRADFAPSWTEYGTGGASVAVHEISNGSDSSARSPTYCSFEVKGDLVGLHARLEAAGFRCSTIKSRNRGRFFTSIDPAGVFLHFIRFDEKWAQDNAY